MAGPLAFCHHFRGFALVLWFTTGGADRPPLGLPLVEK
jgi:hypothetical protein